MEIESLFDEYMYLLSQEKFEEALEYSRKIIALKPPEVHYYYNHAIIAHNLRHFGEAADVLIQARDMMPDEPVIRYFLSNALFYVGRYKEAIAEREYRFRMPTPESPQPPSPMPLWFEVAARIRAMYPQPDWDGKVNLNGKTMFIFNEAGFGDLVQSLRYIPHLKKLGAKVIVEAKPEIVSLVETVPGVDQVVVNDKNQKFRAFFGTLTKDQHAKTPDADYAISCHSLAYHFDPDFSDRYMQFPYLFPKNTDSKAAQLVKESKKFNIGIAWAGNWKDHSDKYRSCHLRHFRHLTEMPDVQVFSIQKTTDLGKMKRKWWQEKGPALDVDLLAGSDDMNYVDLDPMLDTFHTTAEVIQNLDLVVTVDTAIGHIAGALDKRVWVIASELKHDWRWDIPWYDSMTVMRQKKFGDWEGLLKEVAEKVKELTQKVQK